MLWRVAVLSVVAIVVSGCVTERNGAEFAKMAQRIGPPKAGQARIVVFREKAYAGLGDNGWDVKLDGGPLTNLKTGTFVYADRSAGSHQLSATENLFPGVTQHGFSVQSGRTYFFLARSSERSKALNAGTIVGGLTGLVVTAALTSGSNNPGPLDFFPLEETAARAALTDLRLAP